MRYPNLSSLLTAAALTGLAVTVSATATLAQTTFSNTAPITIPASGTATPYPSTISASGLTGAITGVTVTLSGLSHTYINDIDILLAGPQGQTVMLASSIGSTAGAGTTVSNVTWTFSDAAASLLPITGATIGSGTWRPSNFSNPAYSLPVPAPTAPYATALSTYNGTNGNGNWRLYVNDFAPPDSGSIAGGWSVTVTTAAVVPEAGTASLALPALLLGAAIVAKRRRK